MSEQHQQPDQIDQTGPAAQPPPELSLKLIKPPFWVIGGFILLVVLSWLPLVVIARARVTKSDKPPLHLFQDMHVQPKLGPQAVTAIFIDQRAMRPRIEGTVAQGGLEEDDHLYRGYTTSSTPENNPENTPTDGRIRPQHFESLPPQVPATMQTMQRGRTLFNTYCALCHGNDGYGNGPVNQRALELQEPKWVPPSLLHSDTVRGRPDGHLFNTITHGIRNMGGYGTQIQPQDRWMIVFYVRALQLSQRAAVEDVPPDKRATLR